MPHIFIPAHYFCRRKFLQKHKINVVENENMITFALSNEDSVSYGVAVERNRQNSATAPTVEYVRNRRTLFGFSVVAWRLAMPFLPEGRKGCAVFV